MDPTREKTTTDIADTVIANPGYVLGQLARALHTSQTHEDAVTRARAERKVATWVGVFEGMLSGALQVGSRRGARPLLAPISAVRVHVRRRSPSERPARASGERNGASRLGPGRTELESQAATKHLLDLAARY
jgi:hypothetical protein